MKKISLFSVCCILTFFAYGQTWVNKSLLSPFNIRGLHALNVDQVVVTGVVGNVARTNTAGNTWDSIPSGTVEDIHGVYFGGMNVGYFVCRGGGGIFRSADTGITWTLSNSPGLARYGVTMPNASSIYAVGDNLMGTQTLSKSTNDGTTWTSVTVGNFSTSLRSVSFSGADTGWTVGISGEIYITTDAGATWISQTSGTAVILESVDFISFAEGWAVGDSGKVLKTTDAGGTWNLQTSFTSNHLYDIDFIDALTGTVVGAAGTVFRTIDGGANWALQSLGITVDLHEVNMVDAEITYVAGDSGIVYKREPCPLNAIFSIDDSSKCVADAFFFTNTGSPINGCGAGCPTYKWDFNGDGIYDITGGDNASANPNYSYTGQGTYTVTQLLDDGICTDTAFVQVTVFSAQAAVISGLINPSCFGSCNGSMTASATGGTSPYSFLWDDPSYQTTQTASGLCIGILKVTVTDANQCQRTASDALSQPSDIVLTISSSTNVSCNGQCNGTATSSVTGGVMPYTYLWDDAASQNTANATGLCAGTYTISVTDANACVKTATVTINQPPMLAVTTSPLNTLCFGTCDGQASASVSGGTAPFNYLWSVTPVQTSSTATGLCAGTYTVTVTDFNSCTAIASVTIGQPSSFIYNIGSQAVTCSGGADGNASITVQSGGTPPFSYAWSNGSVDSTTTGLVSGTYSVTATDFNGCKIIDSATIGTLSFINATVSVVNVTCNGLANGSSIASASGGQTPYSYLWSSGQTTDTITGLTAATYNITVTDTYGCKSIASANVTEPSALVLFTSKQDANCGQSNGRASVAVSGGILPYIYLWSDASSTTTDTLYNAAAGSFYVTVTDANSCTKTNSANVSDIGGGTVTTNVIKNVNCNGLCDGQASVTISGGTTPFIFLWNDPASQNTIVATGLCAGTYNVTVTDSVGCIGISSATITEPAILSVGITATNVSCNGNCNGSATANVNGGTNPLTYLWSDPLSQTQPASTGLCAGTYSVTVTDGNSCMKIDSTTITQPTPLAVSVSSKPASCNPACDGAAYASASGGTSPYAFVWNPVSVADDTASALCAGVYSVTVTDNQGCMKIDSVTVTSPPAIVISVSAINSKCSQSNGQACATVTGGFSPYTFSWGDPASQTSPCATGLAAGVFNLVVADSTGCIANSSATINDAGAPSITINFVTDATCYASCNGIISSSASLGTKPYTYNWSDPASQSDSLATGLCAGSYFITLTDSLGCVAIMQSYVYDPSPLSLNLTVSHATCSGCNNGSAIAGVSGGKSPYTYLWNDPASQVKDTASGLIAGIYSVTVTDNNSCTKTGSVTILDPSLPPSITVIYYNVSCKGDCDGNALASVAGGTQPYTYNWSNGTTAPQIDGLCPGTYTLIVTDSSGNKDTAVVTITEPPTKVTVTASSNNATTCGTSNGTASVTASGGYPPYNYSWSNGATTQTVTGLAAGSYGVAVYDSTGCAGFASVSITAPPSGMSITLDSTAVTVCGGSNGSVTLTVTGGVSPFTYLWSNGSTSKNLTGVPSGEYSVTVIDSAGCTISKNTTVLNPVTFTLTVSSLPAKCSGDCNGSATVTPSGGTAPYTNQWSNGQTTQSAAGLCEETYTVLVTDSNGCIATGTVTITAPSALAITISVQNVTTCGAKTGSASATVFGGTTPYRYTWSNGDTLSSATGLGSGVHYVNVEDSKGCIIYGTATISDMSGPSISLVNVTHIKCNGAGGGNIDVDVTGGITPYAYLWSNGATSQDLTGIAGGVYELKVTGANNCVALLSVMVNEPGALTGTVTATKASCGGSDGSVSVSMSGGVLPYKYLWTTFHTTSAISGLAAGSYTVFVSDSNGCLFTKTATVDNFGGPVITVDSMNNVACGDSVSGYISISVNSGTPPYKYKWSDGDTIQDITKLKTGTYSVTVTDSLGCKSVESYDIVVSRPGVEICVVTVDSATKKNLVVWTKPTGPTNIVAYNVYRETSQSGLYALIGKVPFIQTSEFVDSFANPAQRSWRYKLAALDSCDNATAISTAKLHKTMHLTVNIGLNNTVNLIWDHYSGFPIVSYIIYRNNGVKTDTLDTIPANLNSYTDLFPPTGVQLVYEVAAVMGTGCTSSKAKSYNSSKSNTSMVMSPTGIEEFRIKDLDPIAIGFTIYPNPNSGEFYLICKDALNASHIVIHVFNILGEIVFQQLINSSTGQLINLKNQPSGIYQVQMITDAGVSIQKVVIHR